MIFHKNIHNDSLNLTRQSSMADLQYNQNLELIQQQIAELQKLSEDHEINEAKLIEQVLFFY